MPAKSSDSPTAAPGATWKKIEQQLGFPLLNKSRGGKEGGMSELSPQGKALTTAFDRFHSRVDEVVAEAFDTFRDTLHELEKIE